MTRTPRLSFLGGAALELTLLAIAAAWGSFIGHPLAAQCRWNFGDIVLGLLAVGPAAALFAWCMRSAWPPLVSYRAFLQSLLHPLFAGWSRVQILVISILAGLCEEAFFRGALQNSLHNLLGEGPALLVASALFGLAHRITWFYALLASLFGLYFGLLYLLTSNVLTPAITHALYDCLALTLLLRPQPGRPPP